jgi:4-hydroxy-tetrahydrodipicolinate reductase
MTIKVGVFGAAGRMGAEVCRAVLADPALELVAVVDPHHAGLDLRQATGIDIAGLQIAGTPDAIIGTGVQVVVDFTHAEAAHSNLLWCANNGVHAVVGTTGFTPSQLAELGSAFTSSNCLIAPNFAIGAVLMMRFAELAAPYFETAEIIEFHHDQKIDAPSGTAVATAERMANARADQDWAPDPTQKLVYPGARGGEGPTGIHVHAVRMRGMVAHQEVILGTTGQTLVIRHDTTDRTSFMPGVVLAVKKIEQAPGLTFGLDSLLDL